MACFKSIPSRPIPTLAINFNFGERSIILDARLINVLLEREEQRQIEIALQESLQDNI